MFSKLSTALIAALRDYASMSLVEIHHRAENIEDQHHVFHSCDLYADLRTKLITQLKKLPQIQTNHTAGMQAKV